MKLRRAMIAASTAVAALAGLHLCSSDRDLEVALRTPKLPTSLTEKKVRSHTLTDYQVWAYFRIDPKEFEELLSRRPYEKRSGIPEMQMTARQMFPSPMGRAFPEIKPFEVADVYHWSRSDPQTFCTIWTDMTHSFAFVMYGAD